MKCDKELATIEKQNEMLREVKRSSRFEQRLMKYAQKLK